ncbi:TetR family transcriptional regulator [Paludisphaera mucosa]|uniref:TetR family transcriptional regulator n=1 Tax=Paludisphaera mucosa TaxID=3030827 RepID=A0ABT6FF47_9BACT|nr:TetR family transcriptional regulator [Paludisphaera mucosa]MDG3006189.1 TetR family transcriptional regulator [Paludisphaera mucosa]
MARTRKSDTTDAQRQRILDAAEVVLRRHGPGKTNVVDVARELGQTHASVYRYFASKAELFDALVERWLSRVSEPLEAIARSNSPAGERLQRWLMALFRSKVRKVTADPELFMTYQAIAADSPTSVARHLAMMDEHVATMVSDGVASGEFPSETDPHRAARAILSGSIRFHHPGLLATSPGPPGEQEAEDVFALLLAGLSARGR